MDEIRPKPRLVHMPAISGGKWSLGRAACGCMLSRLTPVAPMHGEVTCPKCLKSMTLEGRIRVAKKAAKDTPY